MAKYGVIEATNILYSKPLSFQSNTIDIENGWFVQMGDSIETTIGTTTFRERSIYEALQPATANLGKKAYVVDDPARTYYTQPADVNNPENYIILKGVAFRVRDLEPNNEVSISDYTIDGDIAIGNFVTIVDGSYRLLAAAAEPDETVGFYGVIQDIYEDGFFVPIGPLGMPGNPGEGYGVDGRYKMINIRVVRNSNLS